MEGVLPSAECARDPVLDERALYQRATKVLLGTSGCVLKVPKEPKNQDERASISAQGKWVQPVRELHDTTQKALDWALEAVRQLKDGLKGPQPVDDREMSGTQVRSLQAVDTVQDCWTGQEMRQEHQSSFRRASSTCSRSKP